MSRPEWLAQRRKSIGGSDAAGIVGLSKWSTPYTVWADKTGQLPDKPDTEAMRLGRDLEDYVARRWMEATGKKVRRLNAMLYNEQYPFAHADIDRDVVGERAGLECKTTSALNVRKFRDVEFPEQYYAQCVHYMAVTGYDRWYLSVLVFGQGLFNYILERDQAEIDALMEAEKDFWKLVQGDTPPPVDGLRPTTSALVTIYNSSEDRYTQLFGRETLLQEWDDLKRQQKAILQRMQQIKQVLMQDMGDASEAFCGAYHVIWRTQKRGSLSRERLRKAYPHLDLSKAMVCTQYRQFSIKKEDKNGTD